MAVLDLTHRTAGRSGAGIVHGIVADLTRRIDAHRTRKALSRLTDRELDDIGLCRGDLRNDTLGDLIR